MFKGIVVTIFIAFWMTCTLSAQQIQACFSADNCYAVYVGNANGVTRKISPVGSANGYVNNTARKIFNPTCVNTNVLPNDWFYIIAWSDDRTCQGLLGEFTGGKKLMTGDAGWQVLATGHNFDATPNSGPSKSLINEYIAKAGQPNQPNWVAPFVGAKNSMSKRACPAYPKVVNGISKDAKWVWHNSNNSPNPISNGMNHDEFLIFRFPVREVVSDAPKPIEYDLCCPPIHKDEFLDMFTIDGGFNSYKVGFKLTAAFRARMQAFVNYRHSLDPCLESFTIQPHIRTTIPGTINQFNYAGNTVYESAWITFKANDPNNTAYGGGGPSDPEYVFPDGHIHLGEKPLDPNKMYRLQAAIWGNPTSCATWKKGLCDNVTVDFKLRVGANPQGQGKQSARQLKNYINTRVSTKSSR